MSYWMNVSIDLMIEHTPNDHTGDEDGGKWMRIDEELHQDFNDRGRELAVFLEGRVTYELMDPYWPDVLKDPDASPIAREWAEIWTCKPKVMVSNTRTEAGHGTRVIGGDDAIEQLAALRDEVDGTIGVGGSGVATQLLEAGLLDELVLYTHPAVLGSGKPLFQRLAEPLECDLIEQKSFTNGVVLHRYQLVGGRAE
jgi:dihydrofolate reductase